jgi:biotin transport system substrate-specific component
MSTRVQSLNSDTKTNSLTMDAMLVLGGSLFVAAFAQLYVKLPFTPVPITGQTFAVLLVGGALGALRGGASLLLYVGWIAAGLPFASEGQGGAGLLSFSSASGGYLWGFIAAAILVGWLSERAWGKRPSSAIGAMFIGSIVIYGCGVVWLAAALHIPVTAPGAELNDALEFGLYPFVVGDVLKLLLAASILPASRTLIDRSH